MRNEERFEFLVRAFNKDGFQVMNLKGDPEFKKCDYVSPGGYMEYQGKIGILAEHESVFTKTGKRKRAYYLEGNNYQMGYLLGLLAEPEVSVMATDYIEKVVFSFFQAEKLADSVLGKLLGEVIVQIMEKATESMEADIPRAYKDEMQGIYDGCKAIRNHTRVSTDRLRVLNVGVDCLLAHIYTGSVTIEGIKIPPFLLKVPHMCHSFSIRGDVAKDNGHYFGRNFMFPTAGVWQDAACLIVYNPDNVDSRGEKVLPVVSQTAPGMVGTPAAMNLNGAAIGVDMSPTMMCNPEYPGLNSLMLNRDCMDHCPTTEDVVQRMIEAPRGVSWLYPVADGQTDRACVIEAGMNIGNEPFPYLEYIDPAWYRKYLPDEEFIKVMRDQYGTPPPQNGLMPRWDNYRYPQEYNTLLNRDLWKTFNSKFLPGFAAQVYGYIEEIANAFPPVKNLLENIAKDVLKGFNNVEYLDSYFAADGFINNMYVDKNCPGPYYFAVQRESNPNITIVSNHNVTPEMRLTAMNEWITLLSQGECNDFQWRYDILNYHLGLAAARAKDGKNPQPIDEDIAWRLINNLSPDPSYEYYLYYNREMRPGWQELEVHGSVSLFDLKKKTILSLFGYYGDKPVRITLPNYIAADE